MILLLNGGTEDDLSFYNLFRPSPDPCEMQMSQFTGITIQVESNGYMYAGGIWQVFWSHEQQRLVLSPIVSKDCFLMEVTSLLSTQEINLIEQAIAVAGDFWQEKFPRAHWMFDSCEEMSGNMLEWHRHTVEDIRLDQLQGQAWQIVFHRFMRGEQPTECRTLVHYHPERQEDAQFTLEET